MNDGKIVAGMCCSMVGFVVSIMMGEEVLAKTFFSVFCAHLGLPIVGAGLKKLVK